MGTEFADKTRSLTLPRVSVTSLQTVTTDFATVVSVEARLTTMCTGPSGNITGLLDTVYIAFVGTASSVMCAITPFKDQMLYEQSC